jgi:hypothetical protein
MLGTHNRQKLQPGTHQISCVDRKLLFVIGGFKCFCQGAETNSYLLPTSATIVVVVIVVVAVVVNSIEGFLDKP